MPLANKENPQPLPINPFALNSSIYAAYEECLLLEQKNSWNEFANGLGRDFSENIMSEMSPATVARVLGHALRFAPNDSARDKLTEEIMECKLDPDNVHCSPELLAGLAHLYVYGMMRVFYNPKGPTPLVSPAQNARSLFGDAIRTPSHLLTPTLVTTQILRQRTLLRDENRCVFTGCLDAHIYQSLPRGEQLAALTTSEGPAVPIALLTQVAHVISRSLPSNIGGMTQATREKFVWASTAAAVIERFGGFSAYTILGEDNLNSAANAFTASSTPHDMFDCLDLWLLPAQDKHGNVITDTYVVHSPVLLQAHGIKDQVIFRSYTFHDDDGNPIVIPPPHPSLIALHAACAQVAHMSGAAEHLAELYPDSDLDPGPSVMTQPNSSAKLVQRLRALQLIPSAT